MPASCAASTARRTFRLVPLVVNEVVADASEVPRVGQCNCRERPPIRSEPPCQLLGEVDRVGHRAAIATCDHLAALPQAA
jgi:hypothetical protein